MTATPDRLTARKVVDALIKCSFTHVVWLPDTESGHLFETLRDEPRLRLVPVCREGEAVAIAAGLMVAGQSPVVIIQSTGLFESGDSMRGLAIDCHLPLLFLIGYRGYRGGQPSSDSAATFLEPILKAWGVPYKVIQSDRELAAIPRAHRQAQKLPGPVAVLIGREYEG